MHQPTQVRRLRRNQFISLTRPGAVCLRAERGTLWVTVDGDLRDYELRRGESHVFDGTATVVVGTLGGDAVLSATATDARGWRSRLPAWLALAMRRAHA